MYSLERNRKAMKLLFTPTIFGVFIDSGNYNTDPNVYIPILKKLNKLPVFRAELTIGRRIE